MNDEELVKLAAEHERHAGTVAHVIRQIEIADQYAKNLPLHMQVNVYSAIKKHFYNCQCIAERLIKQANKEEK